MATIKELKDALARKRAERDDLKCEWQKIAMRNGGLKGSADFKKLYRVAKRTDPASVKQERDAKAAFMRAAKAVKAAERTLDDALLESAERRVAARPNGATKAEQVYVPGGQYNFWRDLVAMKTDAGSEERLRRNDLVVAGERRDTDVTAGSGFLPPGYLADRFSTGVRPAAVVRNACTRVEMPPAGIGVAHIPSVTTGITVSGQADVDSDNISATNDPETAHADSGMATFAATIVADRVVFERGFAVGLESDAFATLDAAIDLQMIAGTAGSGNSAGYNGLLHAAGAQTYTYDDASPSAARFFDALYKAQAVFAETRHAPAEYVLLHPRRAYYLAGARDASYPLFDQGGLAPGAADASWSAGPLAGLRALVSSNVPTDVSSDQDAVVLFRGTDVLYAMTEARFAFNEAASSMNAVVFQAVTYTYFWPNRHAGADVLVMTGTGLTPPS